MVHDGKHDDVVRIVILVSFFQDRYGSANNRIHVLSSHCCAACSSSEIDDLISCIIEAYIYTVVSHALYFLYTNIMSDR